MLASTGNGSARIFTRKLEAEMMAIDGFYLTAEDMEPDLRGGQCRCGWKAMRSKLVS